MYITNNRTLIQGMEDEQTRRIFAVVGHLGIRKEAINYYLEAFTHKSYLAENDWPHVDNERFEFLGDSVLESVVSLFLLDRQIVASEGDLTMIRSFFVRAETLTALAIRFRLHEPLLMSRGEEEKAQQFLLAYSQVSPYTVRYDPFCNVFEAFTAAYVMDIGLHRAMRWMKVLFDEMAKMLCLENLKKDPKTQLQELTQKNLQLVPQYETSFDRANPKKGFYTEIFLEKHFLSCGYGKTKKASQQCAAHGALHKTDRVSRIAKALLGPK